MRRGCRISEGGERDVGILTSKGCISNGMGWEMESALAGSDLGTGQS